MGHAKKLTPSEYTVEANLKGTKTRRNGKLFEAVLLLKGCHAFVLAHN